MLTLSRVTNTAHPFTKSDQVAKAGRLETLERKPKSSIKSSTSQKKQKQKQNKEDKTSLLA